MEDIAADDDLLSDMLVDSLEFDPPIATHKMNQAYRSPRYKTADISNLVRNRIIIDQDVASAIDELCRINVVQKHLTAKGDDRQRQEFKSHARRYFDMYLPDSGVEFALTARYKRAAFMSMQAETSRSGQAHAEERARAQAAAAAAKEAASASRQASNKGKGRASETTEALGQSMADLCVVATRPFKAGDIVKLCRGGVKDLNKREDEALREEAALGRERRKEQSYNGVLGPGRDFSIIRSSRKMCSQLLLGPARFVNHDCQPNCEFYRVGSSNMTFKCLRDIGINEEITTFYGENYFEVGNAECMCLTCEERGNGVFAKIAQKEEESDSAEDVKPDISAQEAAVKGARRTSSRKPKTPPPVAQPVPKTTVLIKRKGKEEQKTFSHAISGREDDGEMFPHLGPRFNCMTCGEPSWSYAAWWTPEECRRCEHHYRIFKADWPGRSPTEGEWQDKAKASRLRRQLAADDSRAIRSADSLLTSSETTPEVGSPIAFEPLSGPSQASAVDSKPKRRSSLTPSSASFARKKKRIISSDDEPNEMVIEAVKAEPQSTSMKRKHSRATRESDAESDLTSVSTNDGDETMQTLRPSGRSSPMSTSSSSSDRPLGPKSLGKHAKTETLAQFWGAPESNNKRARRPVNNGLESLSATVQRPANGKHRRTASDMTTLSSPSKPSITSPRKNEHNADDTSAVSAPAHRPETESPPVKSAPLPSNGRPDRAISRTVSESQARVHASKNDPQLDAHGLATRGPERTSNSNLAKAWGADLEGGRGSRRRAVMRQASTPTALSSPKRERRSDSRDINSPTPPVAKSAGTQSSTGAITPRSGSPLRKAQNELPSEAAAQASVAAIPELKVEQAQPRRPSPLVDGQEGAAARAPRPAGRDVRRDDPLRSQSSSPAPPSKSTAPSLSQTTKPGSPALPESSPAGRPSTAMPINRLLNPESSPLPRTMSPLAGPPPSTLASNPNAVAGRKNLRWGKGKVTLSRPFGGDGGFSPLAGPAAFAGTCGSSARPLNEEGTTPSSFAGLLSSRSDPSDQSSGASDNDVPRAEPLRASAASMGAGEGGERFMTKTNGASHGPHTGSDVPLSNVPAKFALRKPLSLGTGLASLVDGSSSAETVTNSISPGEQEDSTMPVMGTSSNTNGSSHDHVPVASVTKRTPIQGESNQQ